MMAKESRYQEYDFEGESYFGTIFDIIVWMAEKKIPPTAKIEYAGCGTHNIAFVWEEEIEIEELNDLGLDWHG